MSKVKVAKLNDVNEGQIKKVVLGEEQIALYKIDGKVYATTNICTHEECHLDENHNFVSENVVECTCHGSQFDIKTGEVKLPPAVEPLKTYKTEVSGDDVFVEV